MGDAGGRGAHWTEGRGGKKCNALCKVDLHSLLYFTHCCAVHLVCMVVAARHSDGRYQFGKKQ